MANTAKELKLAHEHLGAGNLPRARTLYRRIVQRDPGNAEAWHRLGLASAKSGDLAASATQISHAIQIGGPEPDWCSSLGRVLTGMTCHREAAACFRQALAGDPLNAGLSLELGIALAAANQLDDSFLALEHAAELDPSSPAAWFHLGYACYRAGDLDRAGTHYERALALNPKHADTHFCLGVVRMMAHRVEDAIPCFRRSIELNSGHAEAHNNLGLLEQETQHPERAVECFRRAIRLRGEQYYEAEYNLARALASLDEFEPARDAYAKVVATCPTHLDARLGFASTLVELGCPDEAVQQLREAVELAPDSVAANLNLSVALLQLGRWAEGWPMYEWRLRRPNAEERVFDKPRWTGSPLDGERILLHTEQGFGDTLQFARYAQLLRARGGVPILECQPQVAELMMTLDGVGEVVARGEALPAFDYQLPLMSLPAVFATTLENAPGDVPYVLAYADDVDAWAQRLRCSVDPKRLRVGLTWAGNPDNTYERKRSAPLEMFHALAELEGIAWFNIQKNAGALPPLPLLPMIEECHNFAENAAAIMNLDLVISVDTSMAHLAGALGRPVWTLLPYAADWRWLMDRVDTPWYPTMRLFRQSRRGDWGSVMENVKSELKKLVGA